jgi:hypothetical protein
MLYDIIEQTKIFGNLNKVDRKLKNIIEDDSHYYNLIRNNSNEKDIQLQKKFSREKDGPIRSRPNDEENNNTSKPIETPANKTDSHRNSIKKHYDFGENNIFLKNETSNEDKNSSVSYSSSSESEFDDDIYKYNIDPETIKEYFSFLFTNVKKKRTYSISSSKTSNVLDRMVKKDSSSFEKLNI